VVVPEAEPVLGALRRRHDPSARQGVPAHVTVLFPFVPVARIDDALIGRLAALFGSMPQFDYRFDRIERFGDTTVFLAPEPSRPFVAMTEAVVEQWPEYPPFEGAFDEVVPHLTAGDRLQPGQADLVTAETLAALRRHVPLVGRATAVTLIAEDEDHVWRTSHAFPLRPDDDVR
jgi:hypothetical protein